MASVVNAVKRPENILKLVFFAARNGLGKSLVQQALSFHEETLDLLFRNMRGINSPRNSSRLCVYGWGAVEVRKTYEGGGFRGRISWSLRGLLRGMPCKFRAGLVNDWGLRKLKFQLG
jgi:hypothetical protein